MNIIDCTPPADLPDVVIIMNPLGPAFDLRWTTATVVDFARLTSSTLPGAREEAEKLGHIPTAWVDSSGVVWKFYNQRL